MKAHTRDWLASLDSHDRKEVVCLLFALRLDVQKRENVPSHWHKLFDGLIRAVDDEYHALKR